MFNHEGELMTEDRQTRRWANARLRHHQAVQAHREAQRELDAAAAELVTAGAALAERLQIVVAIGPDQRRAA